MDSHPEWEKGISSRETVPQRTVGLIFKNALIYECPLEVVQKILARFLSLYKDTHVCRAFLCLRTDKAWFSLISEIINDHCLWSLFSKMLWDFSPWMITDSDCPIIGVIWELGLKLTIQVISGIQSSYKFAKKKDGEPDTHISKWETSN